MREMANHTGLKEEQLTLRGLWRVHDSLFCQVGILHHITASPQFASNHTFLWCFFLSLQKTHNLTLPSWATPQVLATLSEMEAFNVEAHVGMHASQEKARFTGGKFQSILEDKHSNAALTKHSTGGGGNWGGPVHTAPENSLFSSSMCSPLSSTDPYLTNLCVGHDISAFVFLLLWFFFHSTLQLLMAHPPVLSTCACMTLIFECNTAPPWPPIICRAASFVPVGQLFFDIGPQDTPQSTVSLLPCRYITWRYPEQLLQSSVPRSAPENDHVFCCKSFPTLRLQRDHVGRWGVWFKCV